jgi:outer membrane lipopolysaccharide assembly protein LptE/RlpB
MAIYEKPVKLLFHDMIKELAVQKSEILERDKIISWFRQKYPLIKQGTITAHLVRLSINAKSRIHHTVDQGKDDLFFQIDTKKYRLYDQASDPSPIYTKSQEEEIIATEIENLTEENEFAYERDLQHFLAKNLSLIEPGLTLYTEEGITGLEFPVGSRFIDVLAKDKGNNYVVIELKVSRGYDRVVGQILRYMAWIRKNHAEQNQKVRGVIIAREITEDLLLACSETQNVDLFEYNLSVTLRKIEKSY